MYEHLFEKRFTFKFAKFAKTDILVWQHNSLN